MMETLKSIWLYIVTKIWFWFYDSISIEDSITETLTHEFVIHGKSYKAVSRETKYIMTFIGKLSRTEEYVVFRVRMKKEGDGMYTEGWYPLLIPTYLQDMNYGHTQAVRVHWQKHYSYRKW